jgi:formylglycine-generating enzyme required for sulfatase activity
MSALSQQELEARKQRVDDAPTDNFVELIRIAGLDPKKHLRFADWSGVDFSGCDLRGFDFTGARLIGCNFKGARIKSARFDQALIDEVWLGGKLDPNRTNLRLAEDWERYVKSWKRAAKPAPEHLPPGTVFQDAPFAPEMVVVPPGRFMMGSKDGEGQAEERPSHEVTIPHALAVGRFPVTFEEWDAEYTADVRLKGRASDNGWGRGRRPVIYVSWQDARDYVAWLSRVTGKPYRLLSEAEWEYACRADKSSVYSFGESVSKSQAQFSEGSWGSAGSTVRVGSFPANAFGIYDMHGNVWEWCEDCWNVSYASKPENLKQSGGAWTTGDSNYRVLRGGSWLNLPQYLRSAFRYRGDAQNDYYNIGFRVARTVLTSCTFSPKARRFIPWLSA